MKSNIPELRFKEYKEEWEKMKLRNLTERVRGNDGRMDLPTLTISAAYGWLDQRDRFSGNIAGNEQKNYTLLKKGELSYNHGNSKLAKYGAVFVLKTFKEALVPRIYHSFKTTNEASPYFIEAMFATKKPDRELGKLISSGARMDGLLNINYEDFVGIDITVPKIDEQNKIGDFILSLDSTINLSRQELEALKQTKQGFLQKMFPQESELVPNIRFPEYKSEWKPIKLSDLTTFFTDGDWIEAKDQSEEGIRLIQTGNIGISKFLNKPGKEKWITEETFKKLKCHEIYAGDILISRLPEPAGRACILPNLETRMITAVDCTIIRVDDNTSSDFLLQYLSTNQYFNMVKSYLGGGTRQRISRSVLGDLIIKVPKELTEQIKIGKFFRQLDEVIELKEKEIEALKETKKGFLQKMFV